MIVSKIETMRMLMDHLDRMKMYCCIVDTGQLSLAAEQLNLSKGTVSKQLSALERHLGGRLLNRTTRHLALTEAGKSYYERARHILASVAEAECVVSGLTTEPQGTLRINAPMSFGAQYLGELLAKYQQCYPKVDIDINLSDRYVDIVEEGYDLVLRIAHLEDSSLIVRRLAPCCIVLCASASYLKKHGVPQTPEELTEHNCLSYAYDRSTKYWLLENSLGKQKQIMVNGSLYSNNGNLICDAMVHGMGIALLPTFIADSALLKEKAQIILPQWQPQSPDISILYPSSKHLSAKVRAFVDMSVDYFSDEH